MNDLRLVEKSNTETMTSLELAKAFGQNHNDVLKRLSKINQGTCTGVEYKDAKGEMRPMLIIDMKTAIRFAGRSRKINAPELLFQLMNKHIGKSQPLRLEQSEEIKHLKAENKMLEENQTVIKIEGNTINTRHVHDIREELVSKGLCDRLTKESKRYKYPVTKLGLAKGYANNKAGSIKVGHLI